MPSPGLELHLDAFPVDTAAGSGARYLITSPEYQLKRLLAAGFDRVYSLGKCFRRGEVGRHHNPEFTMVEWYRSPGAWPEIARDVEELCHEVVRAARGEGPLEYQGRAIDLTPPWRRVTVREALRRHAGFDLVGDESTAVLAERTRAAGHRVPESLRAWDDIFFTVFLDAVEPALLADGPLILYDWPAPLAALARLAPDRPGVAERFEAYAGGLELANGFGELLDPIEQRRRFENERAERARRGLPAYPIDERFLDALAEGIPASAGVALGVDRLVMLACDAASIRDVIAFTVDEL